MCDLTKDLTMTDEWEWDSRLVKYSNMELEFYNMLDRQQLISLLKIRDAKIKELKKEIKELHEENGMRKCQIKTLPEELDDEMSSYLRYLASFE